MALSFPAILKLLHITSMAVWMAGGIMVAGDIKRSLALGVPHLDPLLVRVNRAERIGTSSGMLTVVTGLALIFNAGGFMAVPFRIHIGLALTMITFFVGALFASPSWRRIAGIIERKDNLGEANVYANRFAMFMMVEHVLRATILVLMVIPF